MHLSIFNSDGSSAKVEVKLEGEALRGFYAASHIQWIINYKKGKYPSRTKKFDFMRYGEWGWWRDRKTERFAILRFRNLYFEFDVPNQKRGLSSDFLKGIYTYFTIFKLDMPYFLYEFQGKQYRDKSKSKYHADSPAGLELINQAIFQELEDMKICEDNMLEECIDDNQWREKIIKDEIMPVPMGVSPREWYLFKSKKPYNLDGEIMKYPSLVKYYGWNLSKIEDLVKYGLFEFLTYKPVYNGFEFGHIMFEPTFLMTSSYYSFCSHDNTLVINRLIEEGLFPDQRYLHDLNVSGNIELIQMIYESGVDISQNHVKIALENNHVQLVEFYEEIGYSLNDFLIIEIIFKNTSLEMYDFIRERKDTENKITVGLLIKIIEENRRSGKYQDLLDTFIIIDATRINIGSQPEIINPYEILNDAAMYLQRSTITIATLIDVLEKRFLNGERMDPDKMLRIFQSFIRWGDTQSMDYLIQLGVVPVGYLSSTSRGFIKPGAIRYLESKNVDISDMRLERNLLELHPMTFKLLTERGVFIDQDDLNLRDGVYIDSFRIMLETPYYINIFKNNSDILYQLLYQNYSRVEFLKEAWLHGIDIEPITRPINLESNLFISSVCVDIKPSILKSLDTTKDGNLYPSFVVLYNRLINAGVTLNESEIEVFAKKFYYSGYYLLKEKSFDELLFMSRGNMDLYDTMLKYENNEVKNIPYDFYSLKYLGEMGYRLTKDDIDAMLKGKSFHEVFILKYQNLEAISKYQDVEIINDIIKRYNEYRNIYLPDNSGLPEESSRVRGDFLVRIGAKINLYRSFFSISSNLLEEALNNGNTISKVHLNALLSSPLLRSLFELQFLIDHGVEIHPGTNFSLYSSIEQAPSITISKPSLMRLFRYLAKIKYPFDKKDVCYFHYNYNIELHDLSPRYPTFQSIPTSIKNSVPQIFRGTTQN